MERREVRERRSGASLLASGDGLEALDESQQFGGLALLEFTGLEGNQQKPASLQLVSVEKHLYEPRLSVAA